jgi:hypothetical protein
MVGPAVAVWVILPLAVGGHPGQLAELGVGAVVLALALAGARRWPALMWAIPVALAVELTVAASRGSGALPFEPAPALLPRQFSPHVDPAQSLRPTELSRLISTSDGRYLTIGPLASDRRALQNNESLLLGLPNVGGYQAVQLARYWLFVRTVARTPMKYNYAIFSPPPPIAIDLLRVGWIIAPRGKAVDGAARPVASDGRWELYRLAGVSPRASVVSNWEVASAPDQALREVAAPGFDPEARIVLEENPALPRPSNPTAGGAASFRSLGPQASQIDVQSGGPAIVLVRDVWQPNWRATVDGKPASLLRANYLLQGIPVGPGHHRILLRYDDPTIGFGLLGSTLSLATIFLTAAGLRISRARRR